MVESPVISMANTMDGRWIMMFNLDLHHINIMLTNKQQ
jgi:hypothetical protein